MSGQRTIDAATVRLAEVVQEHIARETRTLRDDAEAAAEKRDVWVELAAELLGIVDVVAPLVGLETEALDEARADLPADVRARFDEVRRESREAEASGANAKLRRAS